jgi:enoyl-CoA hydratase/carnithine racemase
MVEVLISGPGRNALGLEVMEGLLTKLADAAGEPLLLTGAGDTFSAGLNLKQVAGLDQPGMVRFLDTLERLVETLYLYTGPTVACVNGHAIAGGCILALCCDLRVIADRPEIRIGLNEVALGLEFPPKTLAMARRRVPAHAWERVMLEAGLHDPATALRLGLVDELAPDPLSVARGRLTALAAHPRAAYVETKRTLRGNALHLSAAEERLFRDQVIPAWSGPATKERVLAVLSRGR